MIELICLDFDGTLSNGTLYYHNDNDNVTEYIKTFNVKDGLGIAYWNKIGKKCAIITGRSNYILESRAKELNIDFVFMGVKDKGEICRKLQNDLKLTPKQCACIGDDVNDLSMFRECALSFAPNNAMEYVKENAKYILKHNGGEGVVREMIEYILKQDNLYEEFIKHWK